MLYEQNELKTSERQLEKIFKQGLPKSPAEKLNNPLTLEASLEGNNSTYYFAWHSTYYSTAKPSADNSIVMTLPRLTLTKLQAQSIRRRLNCLDKSALDCQD